MSGVRLQPGAPRHYGGSNRTIIKQAYGMLVSDRTAFAKKSIGALVTLDKVFELIEGNLSNERRTDIHEVSQRFKNDADDKVLGWTVITDERKQARNASRTSADSKVSKSAASRGGFLQRGRDHLIISGDAVVRR